jgi:hypothetical protein|nr:MAG TPA: hypothetical protein [Bacteriophage sp.]
MRKFLINYFALNYSVKVFGKTVSWVRAANVIFPLFVITGLLMTINTTIAYCILPILAVSVFCGFVYFEIYPLKETEIDLLDNVQKYSYSIYYNKNNAPKAYNSLLPLLVNPIIAIIAIIILILFYI